MMLPSYLPNRPREAEGLREHLARPARSADANINLIGLISLDQSFHGGMNTGMQLFAFEKAVMNLRAACTCRKEDL
jgi:hypothetical protein